MLNENLRFKLVNGGTATFAEIGKVAEIVAGIYARGSYALMQLYERCQNASSVMDSELEDLLVEYGLFSTNFQPISTTIRDIVISSIDRSNGLAHPRNPTMRPDERAAIYR